MKKIEFFLILVLNFFEILCQNQEKTSDRKLLSTTSISKTTSTTDTSSNEGGYAILGIILMVAAGQIFLFICCYYNTKRIKKKADEVRDKIGAEYARLRDEQYSNQGVNNVLRLNYYLVDPNNPSYRVWNGGRAIDYQQPIGYYVGTGPQISNFQHYN